MKLIRGSEVTKQQHRDVYKFHLDFMIGDADGSDDVQLYISPNNPYIERFLKFLDNCEEVIDEEYDELEDFQLFCEGKSTSDKDLAEFQFSWPREPYSDYLTAFDGVIITYFDTNGVEYHVSTEP